MTEARTEHGTIRSTASWIQTVPSGSSFSGDDVIRAWEDGLAKGRSEGMNEFIRLAVQKLDDNVKSAFGHTQELILKMKTMGVQPVKALLKISTWNQFHVMVIVSADSMKDTLYSIYSEMSLIEAREYNDSYCIQFSLLVNDNVNEGKLKADGYVRQYNLIGADEAKGIKGTRSARTSKA